MFPFTPTALFKAFQNADYPVFVQVLSGFEKNPDSLGEIRLEEAETSEHLDLSITQAIKDKYLKRLLALGKTLEDGMAAATGACASVSGEDSLKEAALALVKARILIP